MYNNQEIKRKKSEQDNTENSFKSKKYSYVDIVKHENGVR